MGGDQTKTVFVLQTILIVKIFKRSWGRFGDAQINGRGKIQGKGDHDESQYSFGSIDIPIHNPIKCITLLNPLGTISIKNQLSPKT